MSNAWMMGTAGFAMVVGGLAAAWAVSEMTDPLGPALIGAGVAVFVGLMAGKSMSRGVAGK